MRPVVFPLLVAALSCRSASTAAGCSDTRLYSAPWADLSDGQLFTEVERACGRVWVGVKDTPAGSVLVYSPSGIAGLRQFLIDHGAVVERQVGASLVVRVPLRRSLVLSLRHDDRVAYLEPLFPGTFTGE